MAESVLAEETGMVTPNMNARQMELTREEIYRDWLGLKCTTPSHYGLLGVPELEHDATAILHAGRRVKRKLRAYQIGPYRKQALNMLSEVGQAVSVLTNAEKKRAYDRELFARWRGTLEELYKLHCDGKPRDAAVLDAWLSACMARGVPVTRLLPAIIFDLGPRLKEWPPHGEHKVNLLVNMWIYRDAVVLGAALHLGTLEQRVEAVKRVQKVLGLTEGQARVVAEEVTRGLHLFTKTRLVGLAKADPEMFLVRLGRRIRRYGGHLGRHGAAVAALALLLAMSTKRLPGAGRGDRPGGGGGRGRPCDGGPRGHGRLVAVEATRYPAAGAPRDLEERAAAGAREAASAARPEAGQLGPAGPAEVRQKVPDRKRPAGDGADRAVGHPGCLAGSRPGPEVQVEAE